MRHLYLLTVIDCGCYPNGSVDNTCDKDGNCNCKPNFSPNKCHPCARGYFWFPKCWEGCTVNGCQFFVFGFEGHEKIHGTGYQFYAPGILGVEESNIKFDLFVDTNKKYKNMIGGMVGHRCIVWLYGKDGNQNSFEISTSYILHHITQWENASIDISDATFTVQTDEGHLVGLTDNFSTYIIKNVNDGWSVLKEFPHGSEKTKEHGDILCATMFDPKTVVVITTGPKSKTMYFDLDTKAWTEGLSLGNLRKGAGKCSMMEETGHIFVKSPYINTVFDTTTGEEKDDYFERNDLPDSIGHATVLKGKFGQVLFGGSSDKVYYLPKGTKQWIESKQKLFTSLNVTLGCLFDESNG